uniref:Uncharacterized protein n=1 Tax=Setaria viridis TaxID=4556 RepID=A0A4U6USD1_SETVI|nr:hypothetical protein SEVIR_4G016000v2 [Setaria viridis]
MPGFARRRDLLPPAAREMGVDYCMVLNVDREAGDDGLNTLAAWQVGRTLRQQSGRRQRPSSSTSMGHTRLPTPPSHFLPFQFTFYCKDYCFVCCQWRFDPQLLCQLTKPFNNII